MSDFLVVGGGAIGLSLAWELAQRGQEVCVVDQQQVGRATSWVGAGIFPPPKVNDLHDPMERLRTHSHELHVEWSQRLLAETGINTGLTRCGGLYLARKPGEAVALRVEMSQAAADGVALVELTRAETVTREPNLASIADDIEAAFFLPDEMQLRSPRYLQALYAACEKAGVTFHPNLEIERVSIKGNRVTELVTVAGETLTATHYCICGGTWSAKLLEPLGICLPVEPWRGQLVLWKTPEPLVQHIVNEGLRYLVPRRDGHLLVGATVEDVGFDDQTTEAAIDELCQYATELLPDLAGIRYEKAFAGLRPKTPDGHPFMDRVQGITNLSLSAGHYRSGLHLSPISAVFMADLLLQDNPPLDPAPFRINR